MNAPERILLPDIHASAGHRPRAIYQAGVEGLRYLFALFDGRGHRSQGEHDGRGPPPPSR